MPRRSAQHLDRVFGGLPAAGARGRCRRRAWRRRGPAQVVDLDIPQSTIRFGLPGVAAHAIPTTWPAVVVNHILGGGVFSARLFREVREKRGLAYSVYSQPRRPSTTASMFYGGTSTKNERAAESLDVIEAEIAKLADRRPDRRGARQGEEVSDRLLRAALRHLDQDRRQLVHLQTDGYGVEYLDERNRLIEAVTLDDAKRAAKRMFGDASLLVTVAGRPDGM